MESANADHVLHYLVASDEACKARLRLRNETKLDELYFGFVGEDLFDEDTRYFVRRQTKKNSMWFTMKPRFLRQEDRCGRS